MVIFGCVCAVAVVLFVFLLLGCVVFEFVLCVVAAVCCVVLWVLFVCCSCRFTTTVTVLTYLLLFLGMLGVVVGFVCDVVYCLFVMLLGCVLLLLLLRS